MRGILCRFDDRQYLLRIGASALNMTHLHDILLDLWYLREEKQGEYACNCAEPAGCVSATPPELSVPIL